MKYMEIEDLEQTEGNIDQLETDGERIYRISAQKEQSAETAGQPSGSEKKKMNRKGIRGIFIAAVAALIALAIGLGIYNKPENRLARQLDLGERYLEEQNYAEAVLAFEKAIQINERCMAAYVNGVEAYKNLDEPENLLAFYEKALAIARSLEGEALAADMEAVISIYLAAEDIYVDRDTLITLWEEGYEKSGHDNRVQDSLVGVYLERAEERASDGAYEESLQDYDRLLELDGQNEVVLESLTGSLKLYLDLLLDIENFDRIRELAEKYALTLPGFDFKFYSDEILRSQLELPFAPEDVTIFGYKMIEDHFDDIVADLNLSLEHYYRGYEPRWHYVDQDDDKYIEAEVEDDGYKRIYVGLRQNVGSRIYEQALAYSIEPLDQGIWFALSLTDRGLNWLQNHYAESYNLPCALCMGKKIEDWYQFFSIDTIKEIGEYQGNNKWVVEGPVRVTFSYSDSGAVVGYKYPNFYVGMLVGWNKEGVIDSMEYLLDPR